MIYLDLTKPAIAARFAVAMDKLRNFGLKGEVAVSGGIVVISTTDKPSSKTYRAAIKRACAKTGAVSVETRPSKASWVFTIAV